MKKTFILLVLLFTATFAVQLQAQITTPVKPDLSDGTWPLLLVVILGFALLAWYKHLKELQE